MWKGTQDELTYLRTFSFGPASTPNHGSILCRLMFITIIQSYFICTCLNVSLFFLESIFKGREYVEYFLEWLIHCLNKRKNKYTWTVPLEIVY